jgi:hypothetical protein
MLTFVYHIHSLLSHFNKKETPTVDKTMVGVGGERGIRTIFLRYYKSII